MRAAIDEAFEAKEEEIVLPKAILDITPPPKTKVMANNEVQQRRESREERERVSSRASGSISIGGGSMNRWQAQRESIINQTLQIQPDEMVPNVFNHYSDEAMADPDHQVPGFGSEPALNALQRDANSPTPPTDEEIARVATPAPVIPVKSHIIYWPLGKYTTTEVYNLPVVHEPIELALKLHHMLLNVLILGHIYNLPFFFANMGYGLAWDYCKLVKRVNTEVIPPFFMSILIWFELRFLLYLRYVDACISVLVDKAGKKFPILQWSLAGLVNRIATWVGDTWLWKSVLEPLGKMIGFLESPEEEEEEVAAPVSRASGRVEEEVQENDEVAS